MVPFPLLNKLLLEFKAMKHLLLFQTFFFLKNSYSSFAILSLHLVFSLCFRHSVFQRDGDVRYTPRFPLLLFDLSIFTRSPERTEEAAVLDLHIHCSHSARNSDLLSLLGRRTKRANCSKLIFYSGNTHLLLSH